MRLTIPTLLLLAAGSAHAGAVDELLERYRGEGAGPFRAEAGEALWNRNHQVAGEARRCADCHGDDLRAPGRHRRTGKAIGPLAPSANPERLSEVGEVEKWFTRNCKWTLGRTCTAQERGDLLTWLRNQ